MTRFRQIVENALLEAKLYKFDFNGIEAFNNIDVPYLKVYRNLTRSEINSLCNNSKENQLRGLVIGNNIFVWDAYYSNHSDILDKIANEYPSLYDDSLIFYFMVNNNHLGLEDKESLKDIGITIEDILKSILSSVFSKEEILKATEYHSFS